MSSTSETSSPQHCRQPSDPSDEVVWANVYLLLSKAFSLPRVMEQKHPEQLRQLVPDLPPGLHDSGRALAQAWEHALEDRETLSLAYARLFLGPFEILSPPYASFYLETDQRLMGEVSRSVAAAYAQSGLTSGTGPCEVPDHIALEWEFMYYLTHQYVVTGQEQWIDLRRSFRSTHLDHWAPLLAQAITLAAEHTFYNLLAVFMTALIGVQDSD